MTPPAATRCPRSRRSPTTTSSCRARTSPASSPARRNQVVAGTGLGLLHAYDGATGLDVPGFPKQTGGWLFAPAALSDDGRIADITREGYLFEWNSQAPACQTEWPSFRHDQQGTGNYDHDGTPPDAPRQMRLTPLGNGRFHLTFIAPGDNGSCGTAAAYVARIDGKPVDLGLGAPPAGGHRRRARWPARGRPDPVAVGSRRGRQRRSSRRPGLRGLVGGSVGLRAHRLPRQPPRDRRDQAGGHPPCRAGGAGSGTEPTPRRPLTTACAAVASSSSSPTATPS